MARPDQSIVPERLNPDLTPELEREVRFFQKWGYLVVDDAITSEQVEILRAAMDDADARDTVGWNGEPNPGPTGSLFRELLEEDDRFAFLLDNPPVLTRMKALLGNAVQLHSASGRVTPPGTPEQNWHRDGPWPQDPDGTPFGSIPGQINCGYYLDELTTDNGPIVIVPGSHRAIFKPPKDSPVEFPDELWVLARPGQAVLFSGWLYHRGAANNSAAKRRVCLMCYQNAWMKSRETFDGPKMTALSENGTPEQKLLLGGIPRW